LYQTRRTKGKNKVSSSLTTLIVLVTILHVAVFAVMIWIRLRRDEANGATGESAKFRLCAVCGEPAAYVGYDGLDPNEQRDPHTGRSYSTDVAHYQPVCAAHC
jgi:hypothetical protein